MISTYENYLPMEKSLSLEEMVKLHKEMVSEIGNDSDSLELYDELMETATRYASFRAQWCLLSREEKQDKDPSPLPQFIDCQVQPTGPFSKNAGKNRRMA